MVNVSHGRFRLQSGAALLVFLGAAVPRAVDAQQTYRHETGLSFQYPSDWQLVDDETLILMPAAADRNPDGTPAMYLLFGVEETDGIASAFAPEVAAYFEDMIRQSMGGLRRAGETGRLDTRLGTAAVLPFEGTPTGGRLSDIDVFVLIEDDEGLYMISVRPRDASGPAVARDVFASLDMSVSLDPALAGAWIRTERSSREEMTATHQVIYVFEAGGQMGMKAGSSTWDSNADVGIATVNDTFDGGRYTVSGERLTIEWDDGRTSVWVYSVFPDYDDGHMILKLEDPESGEAKFYDRRE